MKRPLALLLAILVSPMFSGARANPPVLHQCLEERGMQFCAVINTVPRKGEYLELTLTTKNLGRTDISAVSLAKVPVAERPDFVGVWAGPKERVSHGPYHVRPEYVILLSPGSTISAHTRTHYRATGGRNQVLIDLPYWCPGEAFSEQETRAFFEHAWNAPKVTPLIGPLTFEIQ